LCNQEQVRSNLTKKRKSQRGNQDVFRSRRRKALCKSKSYCCTVPSASPKQRLRRRSQTCYSYIVHESVWSLHLYFTHQASYTYLAETMSYRSSTSTLIGHIRNNPSCGCRNCVDRTTASGNTDIEDHTVGQLVDSNRARRIWTKFGQKLTRLRAKLQNFVKK
jgi:hypothetical protein